MSPRPSVLTNPSGISRAELDELLARISTSSHFERSRRLKSFLVYVCDHALNGRLDEISEQLIGHRVFGREAGYNPADDNIVRVEARELRKRLAVYYDSEGADEPVVISIPKGSYVPVFSARVPAADTPPESGASSIAVPLPGASRLTRLLAALTILFAFLSAWALYRLSAPPSPAPARGSVAGFWSSIVSPARPTVVAVSDSSFALLQDLRGESVSFEDYVSGSFFSRLRGNTNSAEDRHFSGVSARMHTSLADAALFGKISRIADPAASLTLRFARQVSSQDLKGSNVVFLGSERSNPWSALFSSWRNFQFEYDPATSRAGFRNRQPRPGEPEIFMAGKLGPAAAEAFGAVAFLPGLDRTGFVLILAGTNMQGTEAAGDFLTRPDKLEQLARKLGVAPGQPFPYFEAIVKLIAVDVSSVSTEIIAHRIVDASKLESIRYTQP